MRRWLVLETDVEEQPVVIRCDGTAMVGILHQPQRSLETGLLIVTGGPQYRVGSHRQFVLLARRMAGAGIPVLRFDYRGMGDSDGEFSGFEKVDKDIKAAVDCLFEKSPGLTDAAIWGLCDAASAAMMYAHTDPRISRMILLNPWARTQSGQAKTLVTHYYGRRLLSADFWRKLLTGRLRITSAISAFVGNLGSAVTRKAKRDGTGSLSFIDRMKVGLAAFDRPVMLVISGDDLTAAEFLDHARSSSTWQALLARTECVRKDLADANHTFSSTAWREQVERWTLEWIKGN